VVVKIQKKNKDKQGQERKSGKESYCLLFLNIKKVNKMSIIGTILIFLGFQILLFSLFIVTRNKFIYLEERKPLV